MANLSDLRSFRRSDILSRHLVRAKAEADRAERSMVCYAPQHLTQIYNQDFTPHPTCVGLDASWKFGCLCPCHDKESDNENVDTTRG